MSRHLFRWVFMLAATCMIIVLPRSVLAVDIPHDPTNLPNVCAECHGGHGGTYPTLLNQVCEGCHFPGAGQGITEVQSHSSRTTDNGYGDWDLDCWACHDPHKQWQNRVNSSTYGKFIRDKLRAQIKEINPADPGPYWSPISILRTVISDIVVFTGNTEFVDGDGTADDDICQVCHQSTLNFNTGAALGIHETGASVSPGAVCTDCHSHADGFKAAGGGCLGCHDKTQPNVDDVPSPPTDDYRRQIVGVGGDFERTSHHVTDGTTTEIVTQDECLVCHDQGNHQSNVDPSVWLSHPDTGAQITYDGTGASLEGFCTGCHDSDGSTISGSQPFFAGAGDTNTPPDIEATWSTSSHATTNVSQLASDKCLACHGGADATTTETVTDRDIHGGSNASMLSDLVAGTAPASTAVKDLCFVCHDSNGPSGFDIETEFTLLARTANTGANSALVNGIHDLTDTGGAGCTGDCKVTCSNCHDPHMANSTRPTIDDPDLDDANVVPSNYSTLNSYGGANYYSSVNDLDPINPIGGSATGVPATIGSAVANGGNTGNDSAASGGTYTGPDDGTYTLEITTGGASGVAEFDCTTAISSDTCNPGTTYTWTDATPVPLGGNGAEITITDGGGSPSSVGSAVADGNNNSSPADTAVSGGTYTGPDDGTYTMTVTTGGASGAAELTCTSAISSDTCNPGTPYTWTDATAITDLGGHGAEITITDNSSGSPSVVGPAVAGSNTSSPADTAVSGGTYTGPDDGTYTMTVSTGGVSGVAQLTCTSGITGDSCNPSDTPVTWTGAAITDLGGNGASITITDNSSSSPSSVGTAVKTVNNGDDSATSGGTFGGGSDDTYTVTVSTGGTVGGGGGFVIGPAVDPAPTNDDTAVSGGTYTGGSAGTYTIDVITGGKQNKALVTYTSDIVGDTSGNVCGTGAVPNCPYATPFAVGGNGVTITFSDPGGDDYVAGDDWTIDITSGGSTPQITVTSSPGGDSSGPTDVTAFCNTTVNVGTQGVNICFNDGGDGDLTAGDTWTIAAIAATSGDGLTAGDIWTIPVTAAAGGDGLTLGDIWTIGVTAATAADGLTLGDIWTIAVTAASSGVTLGDIWTIAVTAATGGCWPNCVEPDYVAFCMACHDGTTPTGVEMPTNMVDLGAADEYLLSQHGGADGGTAVGKGVMKVPWSLDQATLTVTPEPYAALPCTQCHEQHGSTNIFHLRESINVAGTQMTTGAVEDDGVTQKSRLLDYGDDPVNNRPEVRGATVYTLPEVGGNQEFLYYGAWCTFCHTMSAHTGKDENDVCNSPHTHGGGAF